MTVVHIAYQYGLNNTGGAAIASTRLHKALLSAGVSSHYICLYAREVGTNVYVLPKGCSRFLFFLLTKLTRCIWKFTSCKESICLNLIPLFGLERLLKKLAPDVIHVQWLNADVIAFEQLARLRKFFPQTRFVINLHDLFMINAIAPHPFSDRRYIAGFTRQNATRLETWLFRRKARAVSHLRGAVVFLAPSKWAADCARQSFIGRDISAYSVSNLIDSRFVYRRDLCTKSNRFRILFGAYGGRGNPTKGFSDLEKALALLPDEEKDHMELLIFGEEGEDCLAEGMVTHFLGSVSSTEEMIRIYHQAEILVFPSRAETQGMIKCEAMVCGLPVVAFDRTACAEGIEQGVTGWIAQGIEDFSQGTLYLFRKWETEGIDHAVVAEQATRQFSKENIIHQVLEIYKGAK